MAHTKLIKKELKMRSIADHGRSKAPHTWKKMANGRVKSQ
jgi:hypothetical protein